ncbi:hypothetical protein [Stenotrophomonas chelatiphaga]|uniref:hypothetical protein n=1 Tax=Stenotrophomonas chelatiphaga TaxID=517011 RepID=UPI000A774656|nr:hypothetical protein [Stenotrophomonas chelatiphaga]
MFSFFGLQIHVFAPQWLQLTWHRQAMDTRSALSHKLDSDHLATLSEGLSAGYGHVVAIIASSPVLSNFWPGKGLHGYLVDPCVQYGIEAAAKRRGTFHTEVASNAALNHHHVRFHAKGVCVTTHFTGRDADRTFARKAVNRGELAARCDDLFQTAHAPLDSAIGTIYAHLLHGGEYAPLSAFLAIPDRSQGYPLIPWTLPLAASVGVDVEAVAEKMSFVVKQVTAEAERARDAR